MVSRSILNRLGQGIAWVVGGRLLGIGTTVLLNVLLARLLGPERFGGFAMATTIMAFLSLLGMAGLGEGLVRFISEQLARGSGGVALLVVRRGLLLSTATLLLLAPAAGLLLQRFNFGLQTLADMRVLGLMIVVGAVALAYQQLGAESLRGFHALRWASLFAGGQTGGPLCNVVFLGLILGAMAVTPVSLPLAFGLVVVSLLFTLPFTYATLWRTAVAHGTDTDPEHQPAGPRGIGWSQILSVGGTLMIIHALTFVTQFADLWIAGACCPYNDVGAYTAARRLLLLATMPVQMVTASVISSIADLSARGQLRELQSLLRGTASLAAIPGLAALAVIVVVPGNVLGIVFGDAFRHGALPLAILAVGPMTLILSGNALHTLTMAGGHRAALVVNLITTCGLLVCGPWLAMRYGVAGLAVASSSLMALRNLALWILARRLVGVWTHVGSVGWIWKAVRRRRARETKAFSPADHATAVPEDDSVVRTRGDAPQVVCDSPDDIGRVR